MIDVVQRIEKIKDAQLREKVRAAILTGAAERAAWIALDPAQPIEV
jgi:hypothetical protein